MQIEGLAFSVEGLRRDADEMESCGAGNEADGLRWAADEIDRLRASARDVVLAYQEANPMRTADMHTAKCGCLRCEIDRLDYVSGSSK